MSAERVCGIFPKAQNDNYQITDLLQLSYKERESRLQCLNAMRRRQEWKKTHSRQERSEIMAYVRIEGILLARQVQDAILFYKLVKKNRIRAFNHYLNKLPQRGFEYGAAQ